MLVSLVHDNGRDGCDRLPLGCPFVGGGGARVEIADSEAVANILASQLVNNELSGCNSGMYSSGVVADETLGDESEDEHIPAMYDKKRVRRSPMRSGKGKGPKKNMYYQVQKTCSVCTMKTAYFCGHRHCGERFPICSQHLRADCLKAHRDDYKSRTGQSEIELFARQPAAKKYKTQRGRRRTTS